MRFMQRTVGSGARLVAALALSAVVLVAWLAAPVRAGERAQGTAIVEARDPAAGTVTLQGTVYQVGSRTRLGKLELSDLVPLPRTGAEFVALDDATAVEFEAERAGGRWILLSLRVLPSLPQ